MKTQEEPNVHSLKGALDREALRRHVALLASRRGMSLVEKSEGNNSREFEVARLQH